MTLQVQTQACKKEETERREGLDQKEAGFESPVFASVMDSVLAQKDKQQPWGCLQGLSDLFHVPALPKLFTGVAVEVQALV